MTFANFDDFINRSNNKRSIGFVFYTLGLASSVRRNSYPPYTGKVIKTINGKDREIQIRNGHAATGYLLADEKVAASSIIQVHPTSDGTGSFALCRKSVDPNARCPICDGYKAAKDTSEEAKKAYKYKAAIDKIYLPFVSTDFDGEHELLYHSETGQPQKDIFPIYWFSLEVTKYKDAKYANLLRLVEHIRKDGANDYLTKIIAPIPADKQSQEYFYELTADQCDLPDDVWNHPLFNDGYVIDNAEKGFEFTAEYRTLLRNLALLQPTRAVNPSTGETLTYLDEQGRDILEQAEDYVNEVLESSSGAWKPYTKIEETNDED